MIARHTIYNNDDSACDGHYSKSYKSCTDQHQIVVEILTTWLTFYSKRANLINMVDIMSGVTPAETYGRSRMIHASTRASLTEGYRSDGLLV